MKPTTGDAVRHVAAQLPVGGTGVYIRTAGPVAQRVDLGSWVLGAEFIRGYVALANDEAVTVHNVFAVTAVLIVEVLGDAGKVVLFTGNGNATEDAVVSAAESFLLVPGQVPVLGYLHVVHLHKPGDALHSGFDLRQRQHHVGFRDNMANAVTQKDLHRDAGIRNCSIGHIHDRSGNAVAQLVRMRRIDFFKHNMPSFHDKSPGKTTFPRLLRSFS